MFLSVAWSNVLSTIGLISHKKLINQLIILLTYDYNWSISYGLLHLWTKHNRLLRKYIFPPFFAFG